MKVKGFIETVFLGEYREIVYQHRFHYISFSLIALGIEFLGACIDEHHFGKTRQSGPRFRRAIQELFPPEYQRFINRGDYDLYKNLRNGFAHQFRPGSTVGLTHRAESAQYGTEHLQIYNGQLILISEDLYEDFEAACKKVIRKIDNRSITHPKVDSSFLSLPQDRSPPVGEFDLSTKTDFSVGSAIADGFPYDVNDA